MGLWLLGGRQAFIPVEGALCLSVRLKCFLEPFISVFT